MFSPKEVDSSTATMMAAPTLLPAVWKENGKKATFINHYEPSTWGCPHLWNPPYHHQNTGQGKQQMGIQLMHR